MSVIFAYITTADRDEALRIGKALVEARLAACINVLGEIHSVYRWEGRMEESRECALLVKSDASRTDAIVSKVRELHSYACPCVAVWPVAAGNPDYLDWIRKESGDA
jgi:periplasmic divalent cation tolerance protein